MKKKRRLKRWVRVTLKFMAVGAIVGVFLFLFAKAVDRMEDMYKQCDDAKGYTCSYYEARLYSIRGE